MQVLVFYLVCTLGYAVCKNSDYNLEQWENFKIKNSKQYSSPDEDETRRRNFFESLDFVRKHNARYDQGLETFDVEINKFADLSDEEFVSKMFGHRSLGDVLLGAQIYERTVDVNDLPTSVDWRNEGAVTEVKTQGECGSDWAFSATGSLEGQHYLKSQQLVSLSEQNLVDCAGDEGSWGCLGGNMIQAYKYVMNNSGIDSETSYPYEYDMHKCRFSNQTIGATATGYKVLKKGSEEDLQAAVAQVGPISVAIYGSKISFKLYKSGVYKVKFCPRWFLDHGMLVVGYGTVNTTTQDYWLLKNSWGSDWGMNGYVMMARNYNNMCGIANEASFPTV